MKYKVYLSGEIHTDWRDEIVLLSESLKLDVDFYNPVTDHQLSDDCGVKIMGAETDKFWYDMKGAGVNAIRTKTLIKNSDIVVVKFGEKYKQWNAAFDAGIASALDKLIKSGCNTSIKSSIPLFVFFTKLYYYNV